MREITYSELRALVESYKGPLLLDCRAEEYWLWETIPGSKNLRWKEIGRRASSVVPNKEEQIVTFCQSFLCPASQRAYAELESLGYLNLWEFSGGVEEWRTRGGLLVRSPDHRISEFAFRFPMQTFYGRSVGSYLIEDDERVILVDGPQTLTDANEDFILSFDKPITVFLTHGPTAGAADTLRKKHGAEVILHRADSENGWLACAPTRFLEHDEELSRNLRIIHTPGHTPGSCCLLDVRTQSLFSGDHFQGENRDNVFDFRTSQESPRDFTEQLHSLRKIANLEFRSVYPFHYSPLPDRAREMLNSFLESLE